MSEINNNTQEMNLNEMEQAAGGAGAQYFIYTVEKGDSLVKIGKRFGVTAKQLAAWNHIANPRLILVGQKLKIYF